MRRKRRKRKAGEEDKGGTKKREKGGRGALIRAARTCRGGETIRFVMRSRSVTERAWGVSG